MNIKKLIFFTATILFSLNLFCDGIHIKNSTDYTLLIKFNDKDWQQVLQHTETKNVKVNKNQELFEFSMSVEGENSWSFSVGINPYVKRINFYMDKKNNSLRVCQLSDSNKVLNEISVNLTELDDSY